MLDGVQYVFRKQRASAWFFVMALCWLLVSVIGCFVMFTRGHTFIGTVLAVVVIICIYIEWMLGVAAIAAARKMRAHGNQA